MILHVFEFIYNRLSNSTLIDLCVFAFQLEVGVLEAFNYFSNSMLEACIVVVVSLYPSFKGAP